MERDFKPKKKLRISLFLILAAMYLATLLVYGTSCSSCPVPRLEEWTKVVEKIHASEEISNKDLAFEPSGEPGHEDAFFFLHRPLMTVDTFSGYLYSEDDKCDVSFVEGRVVSMEPLMENWYLIHVEY